MKHPKINITIEELRMMHCYENLSDEELLKVAESIKELALILNLIPSFDQFLKK